MKYYIETFGCQMNVHDSEKISGIMKSGGHTSASAPAEADILIFNTCCIREKAEQKFFSRLGRLKSLKKRNPGLKIVVAGCIAQQEKGAVFQRAPYVDYVVGPQNIHVIKELDGIGPHYTACEDNPLIADTEYQTDRADSVKAWVTIMYGCDNYCSYCVVPYTRGREISRPAVKILEEVERLAQDGVKEITFLGQNVNSYMSDINFPALLKKANEIDGIRRIRFVTSHPKDLSNELIRAISNLDKVCEHIHLPLQSGSSRVLRLMNRKYTYDDYLKKIKLLRSALPDIAITTDIIAGFPGETGEDHAATLRAIEEIGFDGMFAFKYSPRPETAASRLEGHLDEEVQSERLYEIIDIQNLITDTKNRRLKGSSQEILVEAVIEGREGPILHGRTRTNKIVVCHQPADTDRLIPPGDIVDITVTKTARHSLAGIVRQ
jgi:tRNA-2-methylthio-N6-dimethylallyladenosine synthase